MLLGCKASRRLHTAHPLTLPCNCCAGTSHPTPLPTATSLIIHNSGLPAATLISFIWVLGGMCVAWVIIKFHEMRMERAAMALVTQQLSAGGPEALAASKDLAGALAKAKGQLASRKGFMARFLSLKAAHGMIMFVSWINIAGGCAAGRA